MPTNDGITETADGARGAGLTEQGYGDVLWEPSAHDVESARITAYLRWLAAERGLDFGGYEELWRWSVSRLADFWGTIWDYFDVRGDRGPGPVLDGGPMPDVRWFSGATINYARNALRTAQTDPDRVALIFRTERELGDSSPRELGGSISYGELAAEVARVADGLRSLGVGKGDRVAALLPNGPQAVIALLAAASLGAIWSSCSPDFGPASVIDRFAQIQPKVLIAVASYSYGGKEYRRGDVVSEIAAALPDLAAVIMVDGPGTPPARPAHPVGTRLLEWADLGTGSGRAEPDFEDVAFDHPLWILYSSGTTGLPKPIMHGHGGIVLEHLKTLSFHQDLGAGDVFFWYTTTGWMMWNFLVGGLLVGATLVTYDGSATYPGTDALWRIAEQAGVTYFGVGAPYLLACAKADLEPGRELGLSALRGVGSTGSPLPPEGFRWVYDRVKPNLVLGSFCGGTDLCTGFVGPCPLLPVRSGVIAGRCLGAKVEALGAAGQPVVGEVGELVLTEPMPSMPVGFWNDPGQARYRDSYYAAYPGRWRHGDWIKMLPDGGCVIYGRSDATLNRGGVRMGTSEFYRVVEAFPDVTDSLVVDTGQLGSEGRLVLYVTLAPGRELDEDLAGRLRAALRAKLSPRHVPDEIHQVPGIPRTLSGKKLEVPVRKILQGTPVAEAADPEALANPDVLVHFLPGGLSPRADTAGGGNPR
ncbi:MAG TPA: acetoacetate--CoA ligase [Streptosporangiaceae bacterium]|nr:acetoacetate--CoA ligase [Streptosporangiaceae bacterium]